MWSECLEMCCVVVVEHRARMQVRPLIASAVNILKVEMSTNHAA
jgi:hypothetical protein